ADTGFAPRVVQQVELEAVPLRIEEHRLHETYCPHCGAFPQAALPQAVHNGGLVGPRLTALVAYLKGVCHASYSTVRKFLRDVIGLSISRGQLAKVIGKVTEALEGPYHELLESLPGEDRLNVDETGHKVNGEHWWTWCFRASLYTLFKIDPTRSADVLIGVVGAEFDGVLGCDCFSAYRRYMREFGVTLQFCLAHLIRDVKFLLTLPDPRVRAYGERLREALRQLFVVFHQRGCVSEAQLHTRLEAARAEVLRQARTDVPAGKKGPGLAGRVAQDRAPCVHVRNDAGGGADEQPGGAGDPLRGDRPAHHAGDAQRGGQPLVRADLERDRDVRAARQERVGVSGGGGAGLLHGRRGAVAVGDGR